jgi:alpha-L-rhamnosidase
MPDDLTAPPTVERLRAEYRRSPALGIGEAAPRLSWITSTPAPGWAQAAYEVEVDGDALGRVEGDESVFVAWPTSPLGSRDERRVRVRVWGTDGSASPWSGPLAIEAGLLDPSDWAAAWITTPDAGDERPQRFRRAFTAAVAVAKARLYVTSAGIHEVALNGHRVGDHVLAPGWTAYGHRLRYDTHDVTALVAAGENVLGATVADGWWRGHLSWEMTRNVYGDRIGLLAQLELTYEDGTTDVVATDGTWRVAPGPWDAADLYNGETYDARREDRGWAERGVDDAGWEAAAAFEPAVGALVAPIGPPIRRVEEVPVREVLRSPSGRTILDFGQNLVGWVRFTVQGQAGTTVTLRHAEVLEHGELGTRPLRNAEATDRYTLRGGAPETWEPCFTFHGFRYAEVDGWPGELDPAAFTSVVVHSDMERTGTFSCSHELLNQLHRNVVWGMRGNFVGVPTDCPQRDERLGWTGDLQVFAPTATFLYDADGFLADWLEDVRASQGPDGQIPVCVPAEPVPRFSAFVAAGWSDAATVVPWVLHDRYADTGRLARQYDSMRRWVDHVRRRNGARRLWPEEFQLGDWLDPTAPPDNPSKAQTDAVLVASAYVARSAQLAADAAELLGHADAAAEHGRFADAVRRAFRDEYVAPSGRISSDSPTAYALAICFDVYERPEQRHHAGARLARLLRRGHHRIATGFLGTPLVLPALTAVGETATAYRVITEESCPSWLYPVTMGATTIWERWDSLRPDGTINPGEMTSFNHYAFGSVADWMHQVIGGLVPAAPGYRRLRIAPVPGAGMTSASCTLMTPYGPAACRWSVDGMQVSLEAEVPPNTTAAVVLPGTDGTEHDVAAGTHRWSYDVDVVVAAAWAPEPAPVSSEYR